MDLSVRVKLTIVAGIVIAAFAYLMLVEYGVNAGRIHYGVSIGDVDVGGLTAEGATERLAARVEEMRTEPVTFVGGGLRESVSPDTLGWRPGIDIQVGEAYAVGRAGSWAKSLARRLEAWIGGVRVRWDGEATFCEVTKLLNTWDEQLARRGLHIRRWPLRLKIRRALVSWPRRPVRIPLAQGPPRFRVCSEDG